MADLQDILNGLNNFTLADTVHWIENAIDSTDRFPANQLSEYITVGDRSDEISYESEFIDKDLLKQLSESLKSLLLLSHKQLRLRRMICNPYEALGKQFLLDRCSVKMANIDYLFNNMFTNPVDRNGKSLISPHENLYVADIGGPGGMIDYVLWRIGWQIKAIGLSRPEFFYKPHEFTSGSENFIVHCIRDGEIWDVDNIMIFDRFSKQYFRDGAHIIICSGTLRIERCFKELPMKQLVLCHCILALKVLRPNGHALIALFEMFTPFTVGLCYLMYKSFGKIAIVKPVTTRPSNSERYLVCKWKNRDTKAVCDHLVELNLALNRLKESELDITELVSMNEMKKDKQFFSYILQSNTQIGKAQINGVANILEQDDSLSVDDPSVTKSKSDLVNKCLNKWNLLPKSLECKVFESILQTFKENYPIDDEPHLNNDPNSILRFDNPKDWHFVPIANATLSNRTFFMSRGGTDVYKFCTVKRDWCLIPEICLVVTANTIVYGEIVVEHEKEERGGKTFPPKLALHIIDGIILGGTDLRTMSLLDRSMMCCKFSQAINNKTQWIRNREGQRIKSGLIYCPQFQPMENIIHTVYKYRQFKHNIDNEYALFLPVYYPTTPTKFYRLNGLLFVRNGFIEANCFEKSFASRVLWNWDQKSFNFLYGLSADTKLPMHYENLKRFLNLRRS